MYTLSGILSVNTLWELRLFPHTKTSGSAHTFFQLPLVHGTVHTRRDEARIVWRPVDGAHLAIVSAAIANVLARVRRENLPKGRWADESKK